MNSFRLLTPTQAECWAASQFRFRLAHDREALVVGIIVDGDDLDCYFELQGPELPRVFVEISTLLANTVVWIAIIIDDAGGLRLSHAKKKNGMGLAPPTFSLDFPGPYRIGGRG